MTGSWSAPPASAPADDINPAVVEAMAEIGIDLHAAGAHPKRLEDAAVQASDVVITMGCGDACPIYPGKRYEDWKLDDPAGQGVDAVRPIRDEIDRRVRELVRRARSPPRHGTARNAMSERTPLPASRSTSSTSCTGVTARLEPQFAGTFGAETIERFVVDSLDRLLPTAKVTTYLPLLAERFARERLRALGKVEGRFPRRSRRCCSSACTTPAAPRWPPAGCAISPAIAVMVWSGGSEPTSEINPAAVAAMAEVGIDITEEFPKPWTDEIVRAADVVITMGCGDACPLYPASATRTGSSTTRPAGARSPCGSIRDDIRERVETLLESIDLATH